MNLLKELTEEHAHILKGIRCLEMARTALEKNLRPPLNFFQTAVLFFSEYADRLHHYKEEYLLFSLLAAKKAGEIDLEIGALRHQHELNRRCIKQIRNSLKGYDDDNEIAATTLLENLVVYISILKRHIYREDRMFFPMAEEELSLAEKELLHARFKEEASVSGASELRAANMNRLQEMEELMLKLYEHND